MKYLYGANGSKWKQVRYIPHESDHLGIVYFRQGDGYYRNGQGNTYRMIERGRDNWASPENWSKSIDKEA